MSKFKGLLDSMKQEPEKPSSSQLSLAEKSERASEFPTTNSQRRGRPRGKRSNPDFEQVTAYIRRNTHTAVKIALLQEGEGREFSELVEELLHDWINSRT